MVEQVRGKQLTPLMVVSSWLPMRMESPPAAGAGVPTAAVAAAGVGAAAGAAEAGAGVLQHQSVTILSLKNECLML